MVLTRLRLARGDAVAGQFQISERLLLVHTVAGTIALLLWVLFLAFPEDSFLGGSVVGIVALGFFWLTAIAGLLDPDPLAAHPGPARRRPGDRRLEQGPRPLDPGPRRPASSGSASSPTPTSPPRCEAPRPARRGRRADGGARRRARGAGLGRHDGDGRLRRSAPRAAYVRTDRRPAVVEHRVIGRSVRGRPLHAWRLGEPGKRRVVLLSTMHGNEPHTRQILTSLRDGRPIRGIDLWVVPVVNPDGLAQRTRQQRAGRRPQPQLPLRLGRPRRQLRVGSAAGDRAGDPCGDGVPARRSALAGC